MKYIKTYEDIVVKKGKKIYNLKDDHTWSEYKYHSIGDIFICNKKEKTSEGTIKVDDIFIIDDISFAYWIKCLNRKKNNKDWIMSYRFEDLDSIFTKISKEDAEIRLNAQKYNI